MRFVGSEHHTMDSGALVEEGTHQELIQQQGRYFALYSQQESDLD